MINSPTLNGHIVDNHGVLLLAPEDETVPEDSVHSELVSWLLAVVRARFRDRHDVAVHGRLGWYPDRSDTRIRLDPDVMVVFGRRYEERSSYRVWNEDGVAPAHHRGRQCPTTTWPDLGGTFGYVDIRIRTVYISMYEHVPNRRIRLPR